MSDFIMQSTDLVYSKSYVYSKFQNSLLHISKGPGMLSVVVCYHVYDLKFGAFGFRVSTSIIYLFTHALNVKASFRERFSLSMLYYPYITPSRSRFVSHAPLVDIQELSLIPYTTTPVSFHVSYLSSTSSSWDHYFTPLDFRPLPRCHRHHPLSRIHEVDGS